MYTFDDQLNGESLTLRPEGTAGMRARGDRAQPALRRPAARLDYAGPMFRHERPQKGRYRQFHQFGVEALGFAGPGRRRRADRACCARLWQRARAATASGCRSTRIGTPPRRARATARRWSRISSSTPRALDEDAKRRLHTQSAARARQQESGDAGDDRRRAAAGRSTSATTSRAHFEALQALLRDARHRVHDQSAPGARPGLLQPHRVRVGHRPRSARRARLRRRPLRRAVRAARRQADAGVRLRMGIERMILLLQDAGAAPAPRRVAYVVHAGDAARSARARASPKRCATPATPSCCNAAAAASSRR